MKQKLNLSFLNERYIKKYVLIAFVIISMIVPANAEDSIGVKIISPTQVIPGNVMKIRISLINTQEISSLQDQYVNIADQTKNLKNIINEEKKKITINDINYENPFQLTEKKITYNQVSIPKSKEIKNNENSPPSIESKTITQFLISKPKQEKKVVNKRLSPSGNALKLRDQLKKEFDTKNKDEKLSDEQIKSYIELEKELKKIIEDGRDSIVLELPVPKEFPEGKALTIPINIDYSTELSSQIFSAFATITVTSNPIPKRAILIDIDGAKRDALYNSLAEMPNMQTVVNNGVKFTDTKTVFPSITLAAQASIFTGNYPKRHKIVGNEWFERSSLTNRKYWIEIWDGDGSANQDLSSNVDTIYESAKDDKNMDSTVIFNHYSRLQSATPPITKWIRYGAAEGWYNEVTHEFNKIDSNAMSYALEELTFDVLPGIMTIYFSGLDGYSHYYGPNGADPYNQEYYFKNYVDEQIGRLLNGDCYKYSLAGSCEGYYNGLIGEGLIDETVIIVVADHGQTSVVNDDAHAISKGELEEGLTNSGYDVNDEGWLEGSYNAVAAPNGGMAQIYIGDMATKDWNVKIDLFDLQPALDAFKSEPYVDVVLYRYSETSGYWVYTGSGNTQSLETFFSGKPNYVDAVNRIKGLDSKRSGDIILLAKDSFYFADGLFKGEHGGLSPDESYIPLIFSGPTIRKGETDSTPARSIDMAKTLADLLGFSMSKSDGKVLPVQDQFGYRIQDSNTQGGPAYDWIEISGTGTSVLPNSDDVFVDGIPVGFFFNFYGTDYSQLSITNNGIVLANGGTTQFTNEPIGSSTPHNFIAPFWDDIVTWPATATAGSVYYETRGSYPNRQFIVEWKDNQHFSSSPSGITFEAILNESSNDIKFQYKDVDFGTGYYANNGASATVGIESSNGKGLQYSYNRPVINPNLAILFKFPAFSGTNMYISKNAPASIDHGNMMTYTLYYNNFGSTIASNVALEDTLPANVEFISASDGGTYNSATRKVTWNIGSVPIFPTGRGTRTVTVRIPASVTVGTVIQNTASISTSTLETRYDDNGASASTTVTGSTLPPDVGVGPTNGNIGGTPSINWQNSITYSYQSCPSATGIDIRIHINDGGADITGSMTGGPSAWTYTAAPFYPRHGTATTTYTVYGCTQSTISFNIYIDPAGYIYDTATGLRIENANVWLQRPDGSGGWENVPTLQMPAIMQPDTNPLITGVDGQYQWDVLEGSYRVHVEAIGYYPNDSIVVNIPPPVTDLHVGLTRIVTQNQDIIPPTTNLTLSGTLGNNSWYTSDVQMNLTATDNENGSGVNNTEYSFDNATWNTYTAPFNITSEGTTTLYYYSTDNTDNVESTKIQTTKIDKTPPEITINVPANGSSYILNQTVLANWSANDSISGIASVTATTPNGKAIDTATVGNKNFIVNATDNASNQATKIAVYNIVYNYSGILPPIKSDDSSTFKLGSTIPVKFQLWDANGNNISAALAYIYLAKITNGIVGREINATSTSAATTGNLFRYDSTTNQYIFNLATKPLPIGTWRIRISLDDGTSKYATVGLK